MNDRKLMLVDDEPDITETIKMGLEQTGKYVVAAFNNPLDALSQFRAGSFDIIILDIKMPKMNGFQFYREIRKIDPQVPIAFMTAFEIAFEEFRQLFPSLDVRCLIKKPITALELDRRITEELEDRLRTVQR